MTSALAFEHTNCLLDNVKRFQSLKVFLHILDKNVILSEGAVYILETCNFCQKNNDKHILQKTFQKFKKELPCRTHVGKPLQWNLFLIKSHDRLQTYKFTEKRLSPRRFSRKCIKIFSTTSGRANASFVLGKIALQTAQFRAATLLKRLSTVQFFFPIYYLRQFSNSCSTEINSMIHVFLIIS